MPLDRLNLALLALLVVVVSLNLLTRPAPARRLPNFPLTNMDRTVAYPSEVANPAFPDGKTLQTPPDGTLARDEQVFAYGSSEAEALRAGRELRNPLAGDETAVAAGRLVFQTFCVVCHGPAGAGDGTVTRRGVPAPGSLLAEQAKARADGELFHLITHGRRTMPGYASQIEPLDRWRVVAYVRSLQEDQP